MKTKRNTLVNTSSQVENNIFSIARERSITLCVSGIYNSNIKYKYSTSRYKSLFDKNGIPA